MGCMGADPYIGLRSVLAMTHGVCVMGPRKILWPKARQSHNEALDVAMVWSSLWVTGLCALGEKSVIYDCLVSCPHVP